MLQRAKLYFSTKLNECYFWRENSNETYLCDFQKLCCFLFALLLSRICSFRTRFEKKEREEEMAMGSGHIAFGICGSDGSTMQCNILCFCYYREKSRGGSRRQERSSLGTI